MNKITLTLCATAISLALAPAAWADTFDYNFSSSDSSVNLTVEFTASDLGGDTYQINNLSGSFSDSNNQINASFSDAEAGVGPNISKDTLFFYDNLLSPDGAASGFAGSILDFYGVVFDLSDGTEISLSGAGGADYFVYESPDGINVNNGGNPALLELNATTPPVTFPGSPSSSTPEPSGFLLLGSGLLASIAMAGRRGFAKTMTVACKTI